MSASEPRGAGRRGEDDAAVAHPMESAARPAQALPSRRRLLRGLGAAAAVGVGTGASGLLVAGIPGDSASASSGRRRKRRHKHRHRRPRPKATTTPTPTPTPTPSLPPPPNPPPTLPPTSTPTAASTATATTTATATASPTATGTPTPTATDTSTPTPSDSTSASPRPAPAPPLIDDPYGSHLVSRFSFGLTPALSAEVQTAGGALAWFTAQLDPDDPNYPADADADATFAWYPSLALSPQTLWQREKSGVERGWQVMQDFQRWLLMRQLLTHRSVPEVMTDFWENHLHVSVMGDNIYTWRVDYSKTIRRLALGRFDDLLQAAITHPAMLVFLNGAVSTKTHPNENLGRELLELHTVGTGEYDEDDVKDSARILTGWHVDVGATWAASYQNADHYVGSVRVMDFADPNLSADGRDVTRRYLSYLAHHPATARRIARKLAVRFVRDDPSDDLVETLAATYLANDTQIEPVLMALISSQEFAESAGLKVRTPTEDVIATYRSLGVVVTTPPNPIPDQHAARVVLWQCGALGALPHSWPQPNGLPMDNASWSSPSRVIGSLAMHGILAARNYPTTGIVYRKPVDWLPAPAIRLDSFIDYLAQQLLVRHADQTLIDACCQSAGFPPTEIITAGHRVVKYQLFRVLATILDSPAHMTR